MFEVTLLESSPERTPVLTSRHRIIAMLTGLGGFLAAQRLLPLFFAAISPKAVFAQSLLLGTAMALHALMVCYVYAEAPRLQLGSGRWLVLTFFASVAGFMCFLVASARRTSDWKRVTVPLASVCEVALLGVLVLVPLVRTQALGLTELRSQLILLPSPPPPARAPLPQSPRRPAPLAAPSNQIIAPIAIPERIAMLQDDPVAGAPAEGVIDSVGIPGGPPDGVLGGILLALRNGGPPAPSPVQSVLKRPMRIKVGGQVEAARLIYQPKPIYPPLAIVARIQGAVRLEAVIGTDGRVQNLQIISGHAMLVQAALEAVAQWRYQPTLLNGEPVEVLTEIEVNFKLGD
jgi:protein TonB